MGDSESNFRRGCFMGCSKGELNISIMGRGVEEMTHMVVEGFIFIII